MEFEERRKALIRESVAAMKAISQSMGFTTVSKSTLEEIVKQFAAEHSSPSAPLDPKKLEEPKPLSAIISFADSHKKRQEIIQRNREQANKEILKGMKK